MVLDHRAKQPIEVVIRDQQILELIEADHRHPSIDLVQLRGDIEQLEKGSSCLVYGRPWGPLTETNPKTGD